MILRPGFPEHPAYLHCEQTLDLEIALTHMELGPRRSRLLLPKHGSEPQGQGQQRRASLRLPDSL